MLVIDASAALNACLSVGGFAPLLKHRLVSPPLLWSEVLSVLHELRWRHEITPDLAGVAIERLRRAPISQRRPSRLLREAWDVAERQGWAKTYDAEYVALARLLGCPLLTLDGRLQRGAGRLVEIVGPMDL